MFKNNIRFIIIAGLFVAVGLIFPYFTSHAFGVPGTVLLPMHIPVLLCGLLCGPLLGTLCGFITPVLSSILTGMPPIYPMLPIMIVQLCAMGLVSGLMYKKLKLNLYMSIVLSMIAGWSVYGLMFAALLFAGSGELRALSVRAALVAGVPGLIIQLTIIPAVTAALKRYAGKVFNGTDTPAALSKRANAVLEQAVQIIKNSTANNEVSCVIIRKNKIIHTSYGRGISPLLDISVNEPEKLKNAFVVDKIIGKAAAMILVSGGVKKVYGIVMSAGGHEYLEKHGIAAGYGERVEVIKNRDGSDMCPIEKSVLGFVDSAEGIKIISVTLDNLKNAVKT